MIIYNAGNLDHISRFILSAAVGLAAAIAMGIAYGVVQGIIRFEMEIVYIFIGWCIAQLLRSIGHGVTLKYSVLGAVLTAIAIIIGDVVSCFGIGSMLRVLVSPVLWPMVFRTMILGRLSSFWGMLGVLFRAAGIYTAYMGSRIL